MLGKLPLEDDKIIACLRADYGLSVDGLEFLPLGYDSNAGVYRVQAGDQAYFLKVRRGAPSELSVRLPRYLQAHGMARVIAPLLPVTQALWGTVEDYTLILYPFIDGRSGWTLGLSDRQWRTFGADLKTLHATRLPPELLSRMPRETFVPHPGWMAVIKHLRASVKNRPTADPSERQLAAFWNEHDDEIGTIIERTERLGRALQDESLDFVLCHADIHTANLLIDAQGQVFIVDWDEAILAPKERDLMFVTVGGFVTEARTEALFFKGYGKTDIHLPVMAYYRYERVMEDLAAFAGRVFSSTASADTRQDSVNWFMAQFAPGGMVEAAHRLDDMLA